MTFQIDDSLAPAPGVPVAFEQIDQYGHPTLRLMFWLQNVPEDLTVEHGITIVHAGSSRGSEKTVWFDALSQTDSSR